MRIENEQSWRPQRGSLLVVLTSMGLFLASLFVGAGEARAFSAAEVYRNAAQSVVLIFGFEDGGAASKGTGSILTRDGLVLTNNHVISQGEAGGLFPNLVVYLKPKPISGDNRKDLTTAYLVEVVARDAKLDLALLRIKDAPPELKPIEVGDSEEVEIGESVAAIGHPGGGGLWTLTTGTVSSKRRDRARDIFRTDTAINPGNSGGPLLDEYARLIGINTFVRRVNEEGLPLEGLNYSLRASLALDWVNRQGVTRIEPVARTAVANLVHAPASPPAPRVPQPLTRSDEPMPAPKPEPRPSAPPTPRMSEADVVPAPTETDPEPAAEPGVREFEGPNGESYYGVPNPEVELDETLKYARRSFRELIKRADESIDEMDRLLDDYENF
ncbi:MAG: trypsin-like peptidase domain-containing protein [Myxococcota bacterium]